MKNLRVGNRVLTGSNTYQTVYAFAHHDPERMATFQEIHTSNNQAPLEVSGEHLLFLEGKHSPVRADSIKVGDTLQGTEHANKNATVTKVWVMVKKGIFAPLTADGTIVVDGILASTYASLIKEPKKDSLLSDQTYCHVGLAPFRLFCKLAASHCNSYNEDGMPYYVSFGLWLTHWVHQTNSSVVQCVYWILVGVTTLPFVLLEKVPMTVVVAASTYALYKIAEAGNRAFKHKKA